MSSSQRIYLDNAATSWPKPESVYKAVDHYQRNLGAPSGRSGYSEAVESTRLIDLARSGVAQLIGAADPNHVIFTASGTDSLNMAIQGVLQAGDHVVTTLCEHNSVLRPLSALKKSLSISVDYVPCDSNGLVSPDDIQRALRPETKLVAVVHGSNVTGALQPIAEIGKFLKDHPAMFLVDAAQTLGHVPINVNDRGIDLLAAPGHKGLLGPLGIGVLYIRPGMESQVKPLRLGGTGTQSDSDQQPEQLPDKYEPGNHNLMGIAGLVASTRWLESKGAAQLGEHHRQLTERFLVGLHDNQAVTVYGPQHIEQRTSVVSLAVEGFDPQEVAAGLDAVYGVQCRAGLHCAPMMHESLGTTALGGLVRFSFGWATTPEEIDQAIAALAEFTAG